jgi:hypothetical protein
MNKPGTKEVAQESSVIFYPSDASICAFTTTRFGGVSTGTYASMNINPFCGDDPVAVVENRRRLADSLHLPEDAIIVPHQVHGTRVGQLTVDFLRLTAQERARQIDGCDALMTDVPQLCVGISTADCIPILLYAPQQGVVAAVHAGWRGTVAHIASLTVETLCRTYGVTPGELHAVIGPGISYAAFDVGQEVYDAFRAAGYDMSTVSPATPLYKKPHIDLVCANASDLLTAGVAIEHLCVAGRCTYADTEHFFSARQLGIASGRLYSGIYLRGSRDV